MKRIVLLSALTLVFSSCDVLQEIVDTSLSQPAALTSGEIASGLKQALEFGITEGATKLSQQDGYFKSAYKILLPPEARKVTEKLKSIPGFTNVENIILEKINRGAEDAAKKAAPIFKNAITSMTFNDALGILMGNQNAATRYLQNATTNKLYAEFNPVIAESLDKFSARKYWADAVNAYNKIPLVEKANPDLDD